MTQTTNPLLGQWGRCGWCGSHMPETELKDHEQFRCEAMLEEFQRECEVEQNRRLETSYGRKNMPQEESETTNQMIKQIVKLGKKKIGKITQQEFDEYNVLVKKCLEKMRDDADRNYDMRYGYE